MALLSMNAGLDLEMPVPSAFTTLSSDLTAGTLTSATLTQAATCVINARTKLKDFDSTYMASTAGFSLAGAAAAVSLAEKTELKGAVLLKNDGILPLGSFATTVGSGTPNAKTIAIVGPDNNLPVAPTPAQNSPASFVSGLGDRGSGQVVPPHAVSYAQGLQGPPAASPSSKAPIAPRRKGQVWSSSPSRWPMRMRAKLTVGAPTART